MIKKIIFYIGYIIVCILISGLVNYIPVLSLGYSFIKDSFFLQAFTFLFPTFLVGILIYLLIYGKIFNTKKQIYLHLIGFVTIFSFFHVLFLTILDVYLTK